MRLTGLATHLRSWALTVVEDPGWERRGADFPSKPRVVVCHHTASPQSAPGDYPSLRVVRDGRTDLPGPLSQVGLGRSGRVYVIAAGKANHAGKGSWQGHNVGNSGSVGIEAESPGDGSWTPAQRRTYPIVCAALLDLLGSPPGLLCAHRESALPPGRKVDPAGIDMNILRAQVGVLLTNHHHPPAPVEGARMIVRFSSRPEVWEVVGSHLEHITAAAFKARGLTGKDITVLPDAHPLTKLEKR